MALTIAITSKNAEAGARGASWVTRPMVVTILLLLSFPLWAETLGLYPYLGIEVVVWMTFALGYNLLLGYAGLPSFGHGAFFGIGGYAYGLCYLHLSTNPVVALVLAGCAGGLGAGLVATLIAHRRGIYFALMTIACGQVFWFVSMKARSVTGGEDGLLNIHRSHFGVGPFQVSLKDNVTLFYFVVSVLALCLVFMWRLVHSPFGRALQAIRMNENRARFVGYNVWLTKWIAFTISGAVAGIAGGLLAISQESAYPNVMSVHASGFVVMATLIGGGTVSFWGPLLGALVFIVARDLLGALTETWLLWYGLIFICVVLFKPEGLIGVWYAIRGKVGGKRGVEANVRRQGPPVPAALSQEAENGPV